MVNRWVVTVLLLAGLGAALYWQVSNNGALKAENQQFIATIETLVDDANQKLEQSKKDNKLHAEARKEAEHFKNESDRLRQELEALGGCAATRIDAGSAARLQQDDS